MSPLCLSLLIVSRHIFNHNVSVIPKNQQSFFHFVSNFSSRAWTNETNGTLKFGVCLSFLAKEILTVKELESFLNVEKKFNWLANYCLLREQLAQLQQDQQDCHAQMVEQMMTIIHNTTGRELTQHETQQLNALSNVIQSLKSVSRPHPFRTSTSSPMAIMTQTSAKPQNSPPYKRANSTGTPTSQRTNH